MWMLAAFAYNRTVVVGNNTARILSQSRVTVGLYILGFASAAMVGLRFQVGADWFNYLDNYNLVQFLSYSQSLKTFDFGYVSLVFVAAKLDTGIWLVNTICGVIMVMGVAVFCARQYNPALTFLVAIPYLIIVVGMGYTRQGTAIGIVLAGLADVDGKKNMRLLLFVLLAALFHRTALLVLPLALAPLARRNLLGAIGGALAFVVLFIVLLRQSTDELVATYITQDYESGGAVVRVAMNIVPAILAIVLRKRLGFNEYQRDMWSVFALAALTTLVLVLVTNSTTAIDRVALFLIPLQLAILPRLPYALGSTRQKNAQIFLAVCGYSAAIQLVWLVFATHASYWVPYKTVISGA
jgi:uncharacterized membrane protein YeaQ/YmgE (transglycosylase-associated protein family)